jgi:hypothetical protein
MTVAELIEELKKLPQDVPVLTESGIGAYRSPAPEYCDWGIKDNPEACVYL